MRTGKKLMNEAWAVDKTTGEVVTSSKTFSVRVDQDEFYMTYIEHMAKLFDLNSATDIKVLIKLCMKAEYNTGKISLSPFTRKELIDSLKITSSQLSRSITKLRELELLTGEKGFYIISAKVFWKGENKVRNEMIKDKPIKVTIEFTGE